MSAYSLIPIGSSIDLVPKCYRHRWLVTIKTWWSTPHRNLNEYGFWKNIKKCVFKWITFCPGLNMLNWNLTNLVIFPHLFCNSFVTTFTFHSNCGSVDKQQYGPTRSCYDVLLGIRSNITEWKTTVASFTKEVNPRLAKRPLIFNGRLANRRRLTSLV